ncbi:MAG: hypothetical protein CEN88_82 [Candidatus Berkelbacteria bacterium Licking1014_2]|uniref:Transposase IS200-like domain-containing protein n=1 Tax=Candidatus Berkelbacteria bacterium Licking1014_2 TaxID=2017146 RepID=A0A554LWR1_9BACT|nr:MAG: hypothetical protein CEN88_82 [Candidatus Berkelbacteria bacterium Licking1014_2]
MPGKNTIKIYAENTWYHIYNRGVEKRVIFQDEQDYATFLFFVKKYLSKSSILPSKPPHPLSKEIDLSTFCLIPNHFHFLLKQENRDSLTKFMRRLGTNYAMYFNERYNRVGSLFQGVYKAVLIDSDEQLMQVHRYIHMNPREIGKNPFKYPYSSYPYYIGEKKADWLRPDFILDYFNSSPKKYQEFLRDYSDEEAERVEEKMEN